MIDAKYFKLGITIEKGRKEGERGGFFGTIYLNIVARDLLLSNGVFLSSRVEKFRTKLESLFDLFPRSSNIYPIF